MLCEDTAIATSVTIAKTIACGKENQEIAVIASFFSSIAANLSVIIQNRNCCGQSCENPRSFCKRAAADHTNIAKIDLEELSDLPNILR